jgi:hypothetical protein
MFSQDVCLLRRVPQQDKDPIVAVAFAAHSSREIQAAAVPSAVSDAADDEGCEEKAINDPLAQPEFASASGGDHAHSQAGVTDRVRLPSPPLQPEAMPALTSKLVQMADNS